MNAAVPLASPDCPHCRDTLIVRHPAMGFIRCTWCTRRKRRLDDSGLKQVSENEAAYREQRAINAGFAAKFTGLDWTVSKLGQWGRMVRDHGIGYPSMAAIEKAIFGRGGGRDPLSHLPPDLEVIDNAVARSPVEYKTVLIEHYTKTGHVSEKWAHLGISRSTYFQRKASAERHVANVIGV
jgi:hypothetical protein